MLGPELSALSNVMKEVSFISGEPLRINTRIPIAPAHRNIIGRNPITALRQRVFYNGQLIQNKSSKDVRVPSEVSTSPPKPDETAIVVTLVLPRPTPEHEGVYEMQLFVDISRLSSQTCLDYIDFVRTSDGLNLPNVLVGSATLQVHQQGTQISGKLLTYYAYRNNYTLLVLLSLLSTFAIIKIDFANIRPTTSDGRDYRAGTKFSRWYRTTAIAHLLCDGG